MKRLFTRCMLVMMLMIMGIATATAQKSVLDESFESGKPAGWTAGGYWEFGNGYAQFAAPFADGADTLFTPMLDISELDNQPSVVIAYSLVANSGKVNELKVLYRSSEAAAWSEWKTFDAATDGEKSIKDVLPGSMMNVQIAIAGSYKLGGETRVLRLAVENKTEATEAPTGLKTEDLTTNSVTLWWDVCASPKFKQYNLKVNSSKMSDMSAEADVLDRVGWDLTNEFYELSELTPNTEYWFYVQYDCGDGDVSPWEEMSFRTPCEAITGTFAEDFEGAISTCYTIVEGGSAAEVSGEYAYNSQKSFKSYSGKGKYNYFILPEFNGNVKNFQVSFMAASADGGNTYARSITVGVCTDATATSFTEVKTLNLPKGRVWEQIVVTLKGYAGAGKYIAFRFGNEDKENHIFIDDIHIQTAEACPKPMFVELYDINPDNAKLRWVETGDADEWNLVLSTKPLADPEDIEPDATKGEFAGSISANPYTATNLQPNTTYYAYLQAGCGSSEWTNAVEFKTAKEVSYPYFEDFSRMEADKYTDDIQAVPNGWVMDDRCVNPDYYFDYQYDSHLPYVVTTQNHEASPYVNASLYLRGTGKGSNAYYSSIAMLPAMPKAVKGMTVSFWAMSTVGTHTVVVAVANTQTADLAQGKQLGANIIKVGTVEVPGTSSWAKYNVNLKTYAGEGRYITFYLEPGTGTPSVFIDEISIDDTPDCSAVTGLSAVADGTTKANISWTDATSATSWKVKVSTTEIDPSAADGDIANATVNAKSYTASGLSMGTTYYVYVSPACGDFWESTSVTTGVGVEVPYYNDFTNEYAGTGVSRGPKNWVTGLTNNAAPAASSTNKPYVYNTAWTTPPADVVKNSLRLYNGATNATGATGFPYAIMPELLNADVKDLKMSFYGYYNSTYTSASYAAKVGGPFGQLHVGVVNSPSDIDKTNQFSKVTKIATIRCKAGKVAEKFVIDFSAYEGSGKYIVFYSDTAKTNDMQIDNLTIAKTTDPWKVSEMVVSNITQTGAKLAWKENGLATQWNVKLFDAEPENIDAATPVYSATVDAQEVTFSDLKHSAKYFAYVQSTQASGVSEWSSTSFWTETGIWTLPFAENFNGYAATSSYRSLPEYYYLTSPVGVYTYVYNLNGENFLKQQGTSSVKTNIFALPPFDKPVNTLQMTFVAKPDGTTQSAIDQSYTEVGVLEDDLTFTPVYSFTVSSYEWEEQYVNFQSYEGTGKRIAIRSDYTKFNKTSGIRIDNIEVKEMGDCGRLLGVEVTEIDSISANLSWVKSKTETKWNLKVSTSELTDPENETADFFDGQVDAQTKALDGLEGNTTYYVYIQTVDEAKSCVGDWSSATVFRTLCKLQTFPYFEDFESYASGTGNLPDCANLCGEDADHSYITTKTGVTGKLLRVGQKTKDHKNYFVFPALRTDDVRKLQLSMQVYAYNTNSSYALYENYYEVGIMTDPTKSTTFVSLYTDMLDGAQTTAYDRVFKFDTYRGDESGTKFGGYIAIRALNYKNTKSNSEGAGTILVDNVTIDYIETCAKPTDLAVDSIGSFGAKLIWKTDDKTAAHRVRLFTSADVDPSTDAFAAETVVNDSVAVVENIGANTVYYAFVRKECGGENGNSKWSSAFMLHTNCAPAQAMPYEEGFEAGTSGQAPDCWTSLLLSGSSSAKAQITTSSDYVFSGSQAMSVNKYFSQQGSSSYTTGQAAAVTPALDIESPKDVLIYFDLKSGSTTHNQVSLRVEAVSDETANADVIYITTVEDITTTWKKAYIKVADYYTSAQSYKRFRFTPQTTSTTSGATVYIDNIVFTKDLNAVLPVSELKVKKVDVDSLTFSFMESTPGVKGWKVAYGPQGVALDEATIFDVDTTVVTLKGLTANTSYDIYVRSEKTDWVGPLTASTVQVPTTLPYFTGWEDNDENAMWNLYNVKTVQGKFYHNFFIVGDAAKCAGNGDKALFITNDSANYMSYGTSAKTPDGDIATSYSWATRNIRIAAAGTYKFSFKLKQPGNATYDNDAAYVQLLPVGTTFKAGNAILPNGGTRMGTATSDAISTGCYVLLGKTRGVNDWTWATRTVDIAEPGIYTVAIFWTNSSSSSAAPTAIPLAVDSVVVEEYLCTSPSNFGFAARGAHEVKIKWLAGSCKNFEYVVSRYKNLGQPNLIDAEDKIAAGTISDGPQITVSELEASTSYSIYVRTICPDGYTDWIEHRFTTACELEDLPYTENFAETPECWTITGNSTVASVSYKTDGWTDSEKWNCLQLNNTCYAVLPELSVPLTKVQLELGAFLASAGAEVSVGVMDNTYDFSTFKEVAVVAPVKGSGTYSPLKTFAKMFNLYQGTGKHLALRNISGQPIYIKYVTLTELADCVQPQQVEITYVKENEATVNWLAGVEDKWEIKLNDGEPFEINENPYVLTNLEHGTDYTVAVRALCDAEHTSEWSQTVSFTTVCGVNAMPLIEDFSGLVKEKQAKIQCWENKVSEQPITEAFKGNATLVNAPQSMSYNYTWTANTHSKLGDPYQLRSWDYAPTSFSTYKYRWFISPQFEVEGHAVFSFDARMCNGTGGKPKATSAKFYVAVSTDNGATWKKENAKNYTDQLDTVYNTYTIDLDQYNGQAIRVAFYHEGLSSSGYAYVFVDNVRMNCTDTYPYADNACQGKAYEGYGFSIAAIDLPIAGQDSTYYRYAAAEGNGCDSTIALTITTRVAAEPTTLHETICEGDYYEFGGQKLTKPNPEGIPYQLLGETVYGCDSLVYLYLTVNDPDTATFNVTAENSELPKVVDDFYTIPADAPIGLPFDTLIKLDGCAYNRYFVTVNRCTDSVGYADQVCAGARYEGYGFVIEAAEQPAAGESKLFSHIDRTALGCDSMTTLTLTVMPVKQTILADNICESEATYEGYNFVIDKADWPAAGESKDFFDYRTSVEGCDSIVKLTLTVVANDTTDIPVTKFNNELPYTVDDLYTIPADAEIGSFEVVLPNGNKCSYNRYLVTIEQCTQQEEEADTNCEGKDYQGYGFEIPVAEQPAAGYTKDYYRDEMIEGCKVTTKLTLTVVENDTTTIPVVINADKLPYYVDAIYTVPAEAQVGSFVEILPNGEDCGYNRYEVTINDVGTGLINLSDEVDHIEVFDALGRRVRTLRQGDEQYNLPAGVYMLHTVMKSGKAENRKVTLK